MTELNDHLKLLFARAAVLHCRSCGHAVRRDSVDGIRTMLEQRAALAGDPRLLLTFPVPVPKNFTEAEIKSLLAGQGYTRIHEERPGALQVIQDRFRWSAVDPARAGDAIEAALKIGQGRLDVYPQKDDGSTAPPWRFSTALHCPDCDIHYKEASPSTFSFNSPLGACDSCRGFGRTIGVDYGLVIPDAALSLRDGAIKPWQTASYEECQADLIKFARKRGVPIDVPRARAHARAAQLGDRRRGGVEEERLVRREAIFRLARDQGVQNAHSRAAFALSLVYRVRCLRRRTPEARRAAVAAGRAGAEHSRAHVAADRRNAEVLRDADIACAAR